MESTQTRRSTRLAQRVNSLQSSSSDKKIISLPSPDGVMLPITNEHSATDTPTQPPKKKAATSSLKPKLKRVKMLGKLSGLLSLPLDIFFEITSHLHPLDLLHLSRASRHFACMFLRGENRHAWLAARRTVEGLPDCPSDISEARYAHLLFESVCSGCGKIGRRLLFNLRVRFCASCYKAKVETYTIIDGIDDPRDTLLRIVPHTYSVTDSSVVEYFQGQFKAIRDEFMKVYVIGSGDDFLKERQDAVFALINHGELVSDYLHELQERKEQEKMRLRVTRKLQIDARIMALGYSHNDIPEASAAYHEEIMKPKALTEQAWQGIADRMGALAASRRAQVFKENILDRFKEWVRVYGLKCSHNDWPDPFNAAQTEAVLRLLSEAHGSIPFTIYRFDVNSQMILADIVAWREKAKLEIIDKLAEVYGMPRDTTSLYSASAVIRCGECKQFLFISDVMYHLHVCDSQRVAWGERKWGYDATLHQMARTLLHHAGLARDVSSEHVNELEGVLRCGCSHTGVPTGFLALVRHLWRMNWSCDETFKLRKLGGGPLRCDNAQHAALNNLGGPSKAEAVVLLEMTLPASSGFLDRRNLEAPLTDDDRCCRLCGEACYMQVDMRSKAQAARHLHAGHGKAEVLDEYLCPGRDIFRAAQEYVDAHGGQIIITRMGGR